MAERALSAARSSDLLLVVGSTLSTWSAYRLAKATAAAGGAVAIVNHGATRADALARVRLDAHTSSVLGALAHELRVGAPPLG
jgi:NAD-dependent SIR2 family protein deacetylase